MQAYKCHKVVLAAKIVDYDIANGRVITGSGWHIPVPKERWSDDYINFTDTRKNFYIVIYRDGYISFSPASEFEDGYSPLKQPETNAKG